MTTMSRAERLQALPRALRSQQSFGPLSLPVTLGLLAGFVASFLADAFLFDQLRTPWRQAVDGVVFAVVAAPVWIGLQRRDVRSAIDALTWLNGWETERWQRELGRRLGAVPRATPEILDDLPDTMGLRPLRIELLGVRGELDEAWQRLDELPTDTPWQRFERAWLNEWLLWLSGGPSQVTEMEAAAGTIPTDDDRALVARTMLAAQRSRRAAVSGGDVVAPLASVRPALGNRPGRYTLGYRTGVIVSVLMVSVVAVAAVMVTSAIIR